MKKNEVLTDEERATEEMGKLGVVFSVHANSKALSLLRQMADSICIIDDMACWDHGAMFDLRDEIERLLDIEAYRAKLTSGVELPPLPEPTSFLVCRGSAVTARAWNIDQVREAQRQAIAADRARLAGQEAVAAAWAEGYRAGIEDERTCEANIGIAGFDAKVEPARQNPYSAAPVPAQAEKVDAGFVSVPLKMTREMLRVVEQEDWQWEELLAAANAVTEEQYAIASESDTTPPTAPQRLLDAAEKTPKCSCLSGQLGPAFCEVHSA